MGAGEEEWGKEVMRFKFFFNLNIFFRFSFFSSLISLFASCIFLPFFRSVAGPPLLHSGIAFSGSQKNPLQFFVSSILSRSAGREPPIVPCFL